MTRIRYQVGLDAVLDDPADPRPGGFCRDVVLAHIGDALSSFFEDLEVRELLSADLPMACGREEHEGELLVMAAPGVGGALPPAQAARVIDGLATLGRSGSLREGLFPDTEDRGVLVPPWVPPAGRFGFRRRIRWRASPGRTWSPSPSTSGPSPRTTRRPRSSCACSISAPARSSWSAGSGSPSDEKRSEEERSGATPGRRERHRDGGARLERGHGQAAPRRARALAHAARLARLLPRRRGLPHVGAGAADGSRHGHVDGLRRPGDARAMPRRLVVLDHAPPRGRGDRFARAASAVGRGGARGDRGRRGPAPALCETPPRTPPRAWPGARLRRRSSRLRCRAPRTRWTRRSPSWTGTSATPSWRARTTSGRPRSPSWPGTSRAGATPESLPRGSVR